MKKIYPFNNSGTYINYSQYLFWLSENITSINEYLEYFKPRFEIKNDKIEYISSKYEVNNTYRPTDEKEIYWIYTITSDTHEDVKKYCLFPSELNLHEAYLNTQPEAFLCYFTPPDAFINDNSSIPRTEGYRSATMTEEQWNELLNTKRIQPILPSYLVLSTKWRHNGVQFSGHPDGFNPSNYILLSKPSASWYLINSIPGGLRFIFVPDALNTAGSSLNFSLELQPSRYHITRNSDEVWTGIQWTLNAAAWSKIADIEPSAKLIQTHDGIVWSGSYPLMHRIQLTHNNNYEDFIIDHTFQEELRNISNHPTMCYTINGEGLSENEINDMWKTNIMVLIC